MSIRCANVRRGTVIKLAGTSVRVCFSKSQDGELHFQMDWPNQVNHSYLQDVSLGSGMSGASDTDRHLLDP